MADNVIADAGSGGSTFAAAELSFSGDTVIVPGSFVGILSGSEGSWTFSLLVGGAGAVAAGVQRVTLASDDPAVAKLGTIDADTSALAGAVSGSEMQVDVVAALPAGTNNIGDVDVLSIVPGTGATNLGKAIDTATGGTDTGVLALATRDDALSSLTPAEGDNVQLRTDANGALWVIPSGTTAVSYATTGSGNATGALRVELANNGTGVIATVGAVTAISNALPAGTNAIGKLAANTGVTIGAVEIAAAQTLATVTTVGTVTTCSTVTTVSTLTGSGIAHDSGDSGNPHKIGAKASTSLAGLTLVANADRTDLFAGIDGVQITRPHCNLEDIVSGVAAITDGSSTSVIASAGAGVKIYITSVIIRNSSATDVGVDLRDGAAGSVKATFPAPPDGGGCVHNLEVPIPFSAATAVCADPSAAASTVTVTLVGFKSKV